MRHTSAVVIAIVAAALAQALPARSMCTTSWLQQNEKTPSTTKADGTPEKKVQQMLRGRMSKQNRRRHQSAATSVHSAWLTEILDLDRTKAITKYGRIIKQAPKNQPEKWIAVARLQELGRLGVSSPEPLATPVQAPAEVRKALTLLAEPFPFQRVLNDPKAKNELPPLRPATPLVQDWVRNQIGPTVIERTRPRRGRQSRRAPNRRFLLWYVRDIMKREVEGNLIRANALRSLHFINFKPMKITVPREELYARAIKNLAREIEQEDYPPARNDLRSFEKHIQTLYKNQSTSAAGAFLVVELIRRIPHYCEKLLGEQD